MSEVERRLSVQEKIEELERNKITLHPPVFDSKLNVSTGKKSPPDAETNTSETPKNTIRVIKMNEAENVTLENNLGGSNTDGTVNMENHAIIEVKFSKMESEDKVIEEAEKEIVQKEDVNEGEKSGDDIKKDLDTEKQTDKKLEILEESKSEFQISKEEQPAKDKHEENETDNKIETVQESKPKMDVVKDEGSAKNSEPLVPLTDAEIDKIVAKYAGLHKDGKTLQKYLDFFFDMDRPHYGYFTYEMLMHKLYREGWRLSESDIASMFCDLDADEDWLVSLDEYLAEMSKTPRKTFKEAELKELFQRLDVDKDGFLSRNDIETASGRAPNTYNMEEIMSYDKSGNREKLDFEEFCLCYRSMRKGRGSSRSNPGENDWFTDLVPNAGTLKPGYFVYSRTTSGDKA